MTDTTPTAETFWPLFEKALLRIRELEGLALDENDPECQDALANFLWGVQELKAASRRLEERANAH